MGIFLIDGAQKRFLSLGFYDDGVAFHMKTLTASLWLEQVHNSG